MVSKNMISAGAYTVCTIFVLILVFVAQSVRKVKKDEQKWSNRSIWVVLFHIIGLITIIPAAVYTGFEEPNRTLYYMAITFSVALFALMMTEYFSTFARGDAKAKGLYITALSVAGISGLIQGVILFTEYSEFE